MPHPDWLNTDLFGDLIRPEPETTPVNVRTPSDNPYITVYHSSDDLLWPHRGIPEDQRQEMLQKSEVINHEGLPSNVHPDVFHAGTRDSAIERATYKHSHKYGRTSGDDLPVFMHMYQVPRHLLDSVHSDESKHFHPGGSYDKDPDEKQYQVNDLIQKTFNTTNFGKKRKNKVPKEPQLTEYTPPDMERVARGNMVVPYRNAGEDIGSLSYIIPKNLVDKGVVKYLGVEIDEDED